MIRILLLILIIYIVRAIYRRFSRKKCPTCAMRIPKKAAVCHYCNTKQASHREIPSSHGAEATYVRHPGKLSSFVCRKRGKTDVVVLAAVLLIASGAAVFSYSWYIDSLVQYYSDENKSILYAEQDKVRKDVLIAIIESKHKMVQNFFDGLEEDGLINTTDHDFMISVIAYYGSPWALSRVIPHITWEPITWRATYNEFVPQLSSSEVDAIIKGDFHLSKLPENHVFIQMLRDTYDHQSLLNISPLQRFQHEFKTPPYKVKDGMRRKGRFIKLDGWIGGQSKWNPYAEDEFMSIVSNDSVVAYSILRYRYGKQAAQRFMIIQNHQDYYKDDGFPVFASRYEKRIRRFGLLDDFRQFNPQNIRRPFKTGDFIPATVDILAEKGLPQKLWGVNAVHFALWYVFPLVLFTLMILITFFRFLFFSPDEHKRKKSSRVIPGGSDEHGHTDPVEQMD